MEQKISVGKFAKFSYLARVASSREIPEDSVPFAAWNFQKCNLEFLARLCFQCKIFFSTEHQHRQREKVSLWVREYGEIL